MKNAQGIERAEIMGDWYEDIPEDNKSTLDDIKSHYRDWLLRHGDNLDTAPHVLLASYETANPDHECRHGHMASVCRECSFSGPYGPPKKQS